MLDLAAVFTIWRNNIPVRYVHGLVSLFQQGDTGFRRTRYTAVVEPALARLGCVPIGASSKARLCPTSSAAC
ncbi:contractile injection system protein, VgrG/Pvc8 family [Pseudomonas sp. Z3-8]|uniref:contractile injection system protein, VgrG/Pvc8 family n=1 Tax=Pseudomonas sp. Z3-8 TaxID=2817412 RepID=UPI003DA8760C